MYVAGVLLVCAAASACGRTGVVSPPPPSASRASASAHAVEEDAAGSIFALDVALVDQNGATLRLADLAGHPMVVTMGYASCTSVCPRVIEDMKAVERALGARAQDVRFVLLSLDAARDSPPALRQFARDHHLDLARWRLLAASDEGVRDLAAVLGVRYAPAASGEIVHSALIVVVDRSGVVRYRQLGVGQDPKPLVDAIGD